MSYKATDSKIRQARPTVRSARGNPAQAANQAKGKSAPAVDETRPLKRSSQRPPVSAKLRRRTLSHLKPLPRVASQPPVDRNKALVHELHVHQVELEMQNDELRRAQLELVAARDRFAELFDFAPVGYLTFDPDGVVLDANLAAAEILGVARMELVRQNLSRFIATDSRDEFHLHRQRVFTASGKQVCEVSLHKPGRATGVAELQSVAIAALPDGRRQCLTVLNEITMRRQAETTRASLAAIVETSGDAILSQTVDGTITSWNDAAERLYGYEAEEILGCSVNLIVPPEQRKELERIHGALLKGGRIEPLETVRRNKQGELISVSLAMSPLRLNTGQVVGASAITRDIAAQKQLAAALRELDEALAFEDFFAESPLGLLFVDPDGRVERVNSAQLAMVGRKGEDVMGEHVANWFVYPEGAAELLKQLRGRKTVKNFRTQLRHADGSIIHGLIDANGLWRQNKLRHSRWFVRDISERFALEQEVLLAVDNEQIRFGQDLHDDLCQQLAGIEFLCQRLAGERKLVAKTVPARVLNIAALLRGAIDHARELARGLAPVNAEGKSLMLALRDLAHRTKTMFRCDCRFRCDSPVVLESQLISSHLYRIAQESVSNAIRHGKARWIEIALSRDDGQIILRIADRGTGLPRKPKKKPGIGLRIMSCRAGVIGATLTVRRRSGGGTEVICSRRREIHQTVTKNP